MFRRSKSIAGIAGVTFAVSVGALVVAWLILPVMYRVHISNISNLNIESMLVMAGEKSWHISGLAPGNELEKVFVIRRSVERYTLYLESDTGKEFMAECAYIPWWDWSRQYETKISLQPGLEKGSGCPFLLSHVTISPRGVVDDSPCACVLTHYRDGQDSGYVVP